MVWYEGCRRRSSIFWFALENEKGETVKVSSHNLAALEEYVVNNFVDVLPQSRHKLFFQRKEDSRDGMFVDIVEGEPIPDRSVVKVIVEQRNNDMPSLPME